MGRLIIDIDTVLEATLDLATGNNTFILKQVEIDKLLENTENW